MLNCYSKKCFTGIIILLMLLLAKSSFANVRDTTVKANSKGPDWVTGTVVNQSNRTVKDVTVHVKGSTITAVTDNNGHFEIAANPGSVLVFEAHDYYTFEQTVNNDKEITVRISDSYLKSPAKIDVLYGSEDAESMVGAVSTIYTNQLTTTPASLYVYALPGQLPGLYTQQTSGFTSFSTASLTTASFGNNVVNSSSQNNKSSDNSEISLNLRGQTPITIIDGVQREISSIDPESIESISVLKDGLSTIMLGINSSRGVLLVTTKKAQAGKPRISFTAETGLQSSLGLPKPLPAYEYAYLYNEAATNDGQPALYSQTAFNAYKNHTDPYNYPDVNWFNTILRKNSPISSYKLNVDGGNEVAKYTIGISYFDQSGIFNEAANSPYSTNNNLSRYIINSDVSVQVNKHLNIDLQLFGRIQDTREPGGDSGPSGGVAEGMQNILTTLYGTPNNAYPVFNRNGSFGGSTLGTAFETNLLAMTEYSGYINNNTNDILANLIMNYDLGSVTKGLSLKLQGNESYQSISSLDRSLENPSFILNSDSTYATIGNSQSQSNSFTTLLTQRQTYAQASLDYHRTFGKHSFTGQLLYDSKSTTTDYDLTAVTQNKGLKLAYNYEGKYFVEGALINSSYNRYNPDHNNGWFYAGGLGWQMGKEDFIKDNLSWISSWKWRADYAHTGNANVDSYSYYGYVQTYSQGNYQYVYYTGLGRATNYTYIDNTIANPYLQWEVARKIDLGTDISLIKDHLSITADYYNDRYSDLLQIRGGNTALLGTSFPYENIGVDRYSGVEFSTTYRNNYNKFNYFATGNISTQASKIVYMDEETPLYPWNRLTGLPTNVLYGYVADGYYQTAAQAASAAKSSTGYQPRVGDIKLEDLNGDGVINQFDERPIGNLKPLVFYGGTFGFNYGGFSVSVILQGVFNRDISIDNNVTNSFEGLGGYGTAPQGQAYVGATGRWTPENAANAQGPELSFINERLGGYNSQFSSYYVRSGNYFRLKNAEVGYTLPYSITHKLRFSNIRVFVNGENLATIAGYGGQDPEVGADAYPIQRVVSAGISVKL